MARFLDSMKAAENGHPATPAAASPPLPSAPPLSLVTPEAGSEEPSGSGIPDDEPAIPFIEVGPSRSIEGSPDVLAFRPVQSFPTVAAPRLAAGVSFHPVALAAETATAIAPEIVAFHEPKHPLSGQYSDVLASVLKALPARGTTLYFTGSAAGVGTTTVVLNLAVTAARQGRRVVVVDANKRRPAVAARLALCDRPGLSEVLVESACLEDALQETDQAGLSALAIGGSAAFERRTAEAYRSFLRQLRQRFDLVLIDGPSRDTQGEGMAPGAACDAAFLVVTAGTEDSAAVQNVLRQMPGHGLRVAGCISANR
jgi:Mrp family chromosome partitioning ATPase